MKQPEREEIREEYIKMLQNSWTYERMTNNERIQITAILLNCKLYGNNKTQVCEQLAIIYHAFLIALNYEPIGWREPNKKEIPAF